MKKIAIILSFFCVFIVKAQEEEPPYIITNISTNNAWSNFGTAFYGDDMLVYASPAKRSFIISNIYTETNQPFLELYVGKIEQNGELNDVKKLSKLINTRFHEADVAFTKDKKTMYFTRSNFFEGKYGKDSLGLNRLKMFRATLDVSGNWSNVYSMPFNNDEYSVGHPTLSEDQKTLYFVSDMPGTLGKTDIFKVTIDEDGNYTKPENLGPHINTIEKEMFPFILGNDELYFSTSGREEGLGMLDVYMSKLKNGNVVSTTHLEAPLNSEYDDFGFIINNETREGYFSSNRRFGKGDDDIYFFKENLPVICNQILKGIVTDKETGLPIPGALVSIYKDNIKIDSLSMAVGENGIFDMIIDCESKYKIAGSKVNYISNSLQLNTNDENEKINEVNLALEPDEEFLVVGDRVLIKINTIYFDFDKSEIREDASLELNKAIEIMKKYPKLIVEFGAHCDSRGPDSYNEKLSTRRANSTVEYMFARGIPRDRLTGRGYGESRLVNQCSNGVRCTEDEHQLNRRTEFLILNPETIKSKGN